MFKSRIPQLVLVLTFLPLCWLGMMIVHESGHVLAALISGVKIDRVVLHPLAISQTDVAENESPSFIVWMGPLFGTIAPLLAWQCASMLQRPLAFLFRFFAAFCCVANGIYLSLGTVQGVGDPAELMAHGSPAWPMWIFGTATVTMGFFLWNGQGPCFGWGGPPQAVSSNAATWSAVLLFVVIVAELIWSAVNNRP